VTIPVNTSVTTARHQSGEGGQLGSCIILVRADTDVTIATTENITVTINDNELATGGTDTVVASLAQTAVGEKVYAAGETIAEFILPRTVKEFTSVTVATDDAAASGTFSAFLSSPMGRSNV